MRAFFARGILGRLTGSRQDDPVAPDLLPGPGRLILAAVCLDPILEDVTAVAEAGSLVAIVGSDAAARSALLSVAAGIAKPHRGQVSLDGQDLALHSGGSVHRALLLVREGDRLDPARASAQVLLVDVPDVDVDLVLSAARGRSTVLVASHRREVLRAADSIWLLDRGRIVESGPPPLLLGDGSRTERVLALDPPS